MIEISREKWFMNYVKSKYPRAYKDFIKMEKKEKELKAQQEKEK